MTSKRPARATWTWRPALVVLAVLSAACGGETTTAAAEDSARIERVFAGLRPRVAIKDAPTVRWTLASRMDAHHVPGISIAVIDSGRIVWARGVGLKEAGGTDSVTAATLFQAASISKPVAATGLLKLAQDGKVSLDENVNTYLRSWQVPDNKFTATEKVTLRRIVSHNAGLTVHGFPGYAENVPVPTTVQVLTGGPPANTAAVHVDTFPGAISRYSGGGITVEQLAIEDVTGKPFAVYMKETVLDPMGMTRSTYEQPLPASRRAEAASAHGSTGQVIAGKWHTYPEMAAAGLWTTPTDLATWALEVAAARAGRSNRVLSTDMATQMLTAQKAPFGLGPMLQGSGNAFAFGHGGANEGFRCQLIYFPELGKGAAVMTNGDDGSALTDEIFMALAAEYGWPDHEQRERATVPLDSAALSALAGEYHTPNPGAPAGPPVTVLVRQEGSHLTMEAPPFVPRFDLHPAAADTFFSLTDQRVVFTRDATGRATQVRFAGVVATRAR